MTTKPIAGFHIIRFGTAADQQFLLGEFLPTYDQLIINANMVAHMPSALASLLSIKAKNKPYFIDPQTHAFQHNISYIESDSENRVGSIKRSLQKLMDAFGNPVLSSIGKEHRPLLPSDFNSKGIVEGFCERVLKFQAQAITKEANQSEAAKYYKYLNKFHKRQEKTANLFSPTLVIAPYFYLASNTFKDWLPINIKCANASKEIAKDIKLPLGVQVVISKELLIDSAKIQELVTQYVAVKPEVFLIWVDSFAEQDASEQELKGFIGLCEKLGKVSPVINLYGGFFSVALHHCGILNNLIGVAHGLEYGESRGVVPVGGGIPTAKFYFPALNTRLLFRDALRAVRAVGGHKSVEDFHKKVCDCKTCREEIISNPETDFEKYGKNRPIRFMRGGQSIAMGYPLPETKARTVKHYLWCKKNEYGYQCSTDDLVRRLADIKSKLEKTLDLENLSHCDIWAKVIKDHKSKV